MNRRYTNSHVSIEGFRPDRNSPLASFRPEDKYCVVRTYLRYRDELVSARSTQCHHLQKALQQMNVQLHHVLIDVSGVSGWRIIEAILDG
jgi:transposase